MTTGWGEIKDIKLGRKKKKEIPGRGKSVQEGGTSNNIDKKYVGGESRKENTSSGQKIRRKGTGLGGKKKNKSF